MTDHAATCVIHRDPARCDCAVTIAYPSLVEQLAQARAGARSTPISLDECRRVVAARPPVLLGTPEWVAHLQAAMTEVDRQNWLLAHFRRCATDGLMKEVGHSELAGRVRMLLRSDIDFEPTVQAARDRIIWLAEQLHVAQEALAKARKDHAQEIRDLEREARESSRDTVAFERHRASSEFRGEDM